MSHSHPSVCDSAYVHGVIIGGLVFAVVSALLTAVVLSWFMLRHAAAPDPEDGR